MTEPLILAFDTSAACCAAALLSGDRILAERLEPMQKGQAERLFPMLEELLTETGHEWRSLAALGVGIGPGNFTGVRIAVAAARGLTLSLGVPAFGVSAFECVLGAMPASDRILVTLAAPRDMVHVQVFQSGVAVGRPDLVDPTDPPSGMLAGVTHVLGHRGDEIGRRFALSGETTTRPDSAVVIARIAGDRLRRGGLPAPPSPLYVRPADAAPPADPPPIILP